MSKQVFDLSGNFVKNAEANLDDSGKIKQTDFFDDYTKGGVTGLFLRIYPSGKRAWCVRYKLAGKKRSKTLGGSDVLACADARKKARTALSKALGNTDPAGRRDEQGNTVVTFGDICAEYLEKHAKIKKRSWKTDERYINVELSSWKDRPARSIRRKDLTALLDGIMERRRPRERTGRERTGSPSTASHVLALIETIFNKAIGRGDVEMVNPGFKYELATPEPVGARALEDDEVRQLWSLLDTKPAKEAAFVRLCLLTGARAREVLQLPLKEIDFEMGVWNLPKERNKNKKVDFVGPLAPMTMDMIESLRNGSPYLFPMQDKTAPMVAFAPWFDGSRKRKGLRDELNFKEDWSCHSLRKTVVTGMTKLGIPQSLALMCTNHITSTKIGEIYDKHNYLEEKRAALTKWAAKLAEIVGINATDASTPASAPNMAA